MKTLIPVFVISVLVTIIAFFFLRWALAVQGMELGLHGSIAMAAGVFFTMLLGCGLMALLFYSNKSGHDDIASGGDTDRGPSASDDLPPTP